MYIVHRNSMHFSKLGPSERVCSGGNFRGLVGNAVKTLTAYLALMSEF